MKRKNISAIALSLALSSVLAVGMTACSPDNPSVEPNPTYTYRTYTSVSPSNWNLLAQDDNNDRQVSDYLNGTFFDFDFAYDDSGNIIDGGFVVHYSAASNLEDVTAEYAGSYGIPEGTAGNRAWRLTLREDLKWNDGTAITASDFVYSISIPTRKKRRIREEPIRDCSFSGAIKARRLP